nr:MAG TPA: DNA pilot protein VP2 [Microviridae sp.]
MLCLFVSLYIYIMIRVKYLDSTIGPNLKCTPFPIGAAIQGGSAILGSVLGGIFGSKSQNSANAANLQINRENNAFNERMMQKQLDYNTDMWNKQNAYNTPSAQVQRLKEAGLNPYLMMSNGNQIGTASSANSASMASASGNPNMQAYDPSSGISNGVNAIGGAIANYISMKKAESEISKMNFENKLLEQQIISMSKDNEYKSLMNDEMLRGFKFDNYKKSAEYENQLWSNRYQQETFNSDVGIKRLQEQNLANQNVIQGLTALQMSLNNRQLQNEINAFPKRLKAELNEAYARAFSAYASGKASLSQCALNFKYGVTELLKQRAQHYENVITLRSINSLVQTAKYTASQAKWQSHMMNNASLNSDRDAQGWNYYLYRYSQPVLTGLGLGTGVFLGLRGSKHTKIKGF